MPKLSKKILKKGYTLVDVGRGTKTEYKAPREWFGPAIDELHRIYQEGKTPFVLVDSKPDTSKFQFGIVAGECLPISGTRCVVSPRSQLNEQHAEQLESWIDQKYVEKDWSAGIRGIRELHEKVKKYNDPTFILDEWEQEDKEKINNIGFIVLDELHLYSKNHADDLQMLTNVLNYLRSKNLKLVLGTTATGKNLKGIWEWAGKNELFYVKQDKYTIRPSIELLKKDGWQEVPTSWIWADQNTYIVDLTKLEQNDIDIHDEEAVKNYYQKIDHAHENSTTEELMDVGHRLNWREKYKEYQTQFETYLENRIDAVMKHIIKNDSDKEPTLVQIFGINRGINAEKKYQASFLPRGSRILAWNSRTKSTHPEYKNNEKKLMKDWLDPNHPLKILIIDEMLTTGTNKPIKNVYKTSYSKNNIDGAVQLIYRGKKAFIVFDAIVLNSFKKSVKQRLELLKKHMESIDMPYDERKLQQLAGLWEIRQKNRENDEGGKLGDPLPESVNPEELAPESKTPIQHGEDFHNENIWVVGFDNDKVISMPTDTNAIHVSLPQKARSLISIFEE